MHSQIVDIPYQKFVLPNGLTVIVHEDHKAPIVALNVWYHVGSKNEKPGKTGFAHLFEHLMFGGSGNIQDTYIEAMERVGATDLNGTTNEDRTNYFENVPVSAFDYALFAESDRMGHFHDAIGQDVLDLQRGVVENEKRQGDNQPYAVADELITKATYPAHHPYAHTVIGSMEDLKGASLDDVKDWFKTYYGPSNAVLVVAGDIDFHTARQKVTKYFGDIPPGPPIAHKQEWVAKMVSEHRETVQDRVPLARSYKVWNVPQYGTADATYLNLISSILTSGKSSRLYKRLVYDDQIAANVMTYIDQKEIGGQFLVMATAKPGESLAAIEKAITEEMTRFLKEGPTTDELDRAKTQALAGFIRGAERIGGFGGKSDILARSQTYTGSPDGYKQVLARIEAATAAQLKESARTWLSDGAYILNVEPFPQMAANDEGVDRTKLPEVPPNVIPSFPKLEKATLSNGLRLILAERHDIPLINFWLQVEAGYAADEFATPGTSKLMASLLTSGTKTRTALQVSDEAQSFGAVLTAGGGLDLTTVYLSALKSKLDPSLHLYADVILNPVFPESDFKRQQSLQIAGIENEKATPTQMALRVLPPLLYGAGHAYSAPLTGSGTIETVSAITRDQVAAFHQTWFKPNNATLIVVGDTTLAEIVPKLEQLFEDWKGGETPKVHIGHVPGPQAQQIYLIDKPGALQSVIIGGSMAPPPNAADEIAFEMANNCFGGTFSARLNMNLREEKHWSYGAQSLLYGARGQRPFISIAGVQTDKTKESVAEMNRELQEMIAGRPVSEAELARVKNQAILEMGGSRETMTAIGSAIADIIEFKLPDDYWDTYGDKVGRLTEFEVNGAAKTLLQPQKTVWVIVGDRASIEEGIRSLDLGIIHHVDADGKRVE